MFQKQRIAVGIAIPAMIAVALMMAFWPQLTQGIAVPADDPASRLAFVAHWMLLPGLTLLAGVMAVGRRGFYENAIEGTRTPSQWTLEVNLRYNTNTLEQVALLAIAWFALAVDAPIGHLAAIPIMAWVFVVGRVTFWIGYALNPLARTFGMTLTALPTVLLYAWLVWNRLS